MVSHTYQFRARSLSLLRRSVSCYTMANIFTPKFLTEQNINVILKNYFEDNDFILESFQVVIASDKMIGFLCDYWKLKVTAKSGNEEIKHLQFFVKSVCEHNPAKAAMVNEMRLFQKEIFFYNIVKKYMNKDGLKTWSPDCIAVTDDALVLEDLNFTGYRNNNKLVHFDMAHTLQALETLATFHSISIMYEADKSNRGSQCYIKDNYEEYLDEAGYADSNTWFKQCMKGALEAVTTFSKYSPRDLKLIEERWSEVWLSALRLCDPSSNRCNVICHRDLWNNNILFHYNLENEPDGCALVDFQAIKLMPPAGDVMMLLYCNLDPSFREQNIHLFLDYYYSKLERILENKGYQISKLLAKDQFMTSAEEQRKWGLIVCACLLPQIWIDDEITTSIFSNTERFENIMSRNKGQFIKKMMRNNEDYKCKIIEILHEIIDKYILI